MPHAPFQPKPHADILRGVFDLTRGGLTRELADRILAMEFPESDAMRISEL
jgi:hypothetical protein